jgi:carboxymethylenebutenolidase
VADISFVVNDRTIPGYLAGPDGALQAEAGQAGAGQVEAGESARWPGVVVIHEAFGLTDDIRRKADEFAAHGYLAVAPDLYEGKSWPGCVRQAFKQLRSGTGPAFDVLDAARTLLTERPDCTGKVGVIGFCMGGGFALLCAPRTGYDAAAVNYGDVPKDAEDALAGSCPIVGSFGARDLMGTKPPERLQRALAVLDIRHDVKVYPNSGHRFMTKTGGGAAVLAKITRMSYNEDDAADAWHRIYAFFGEALSGASETSGETAAG